MPLMKELLHVPQRVHQGDFVLKLAEGVQQAEQTLHRPASRATALGLCVGASTIKVVELVDAAGGARPGRTEVVRHEGNTRASLARVFHAYPPGGYDYVCLTGRKHRTLVNLPSVTEPEAVERALGYLRARGASPVTGLLSLGSENFIFYELNSDGSLAGVRTGNKCASGTGEFLLQQIGRMDLTLEGAIERSRGARPYSVCGRCSVFCKSDCTHALNKGIPVERVAAGLGNMIAEKALEILGTAPRRDVMVVGGVSRNDYVMSELARHVQRLVIPEDAEVFEAFGAALCALQDRHRPPARVEFAPRGSVYARLLPLGEARPQVGFQQSERGIPTEGDETILGLDVGSTTTKAVLLRTSDSRILASVYLRTAGNPIGASRRCYRELEAQLGGIRVKIVGLGVTGSGRHISGLHARTEGIINEIVAHATAAAFFDERVDTIFEIGGQDAKYTYLVNGVPCDYAMNEACSAGTGSFLEEAAKETLGIDVRDIEPIALRAEAPPNFNDQCAAFISSDIKNASHEMGRDDIVAGLVYSICMNYANRVKGNRKVGDRIFVQGGVCYNRAVPLAMASLLQKPITVPPDPGLMGAFGVALEVRQRVALGLLPRGEFRLAELAAREVAYGKTFTCPGTSERCDRGCEVSVIKLEGRSYPFGGVCNKYYNVAHGVRIQAEPYDWVSQRQRALYGSLPAPREPVRGSVGLTRSFFVNLLYPLYASFFAELGFSVVMSERADPEGMRRVHASFCHPAVIAHGMLLDLARKKPDYIFLPHVQELYVEASQSREPGHQSTCVTALAEPYYLKAAFRDLWVPVLSPQLNFRSGWRSCAERFVELAKRLGSSRAQGRRAFDCAAAQFEEFLEARRRIGREALAEIEADPGRVAIVLFGRPYNAFSDDANLGIPRKFASRGVHVIPFDCLPFQGEAATERMTWAMGQDLTRAARYVKRHPQLFGAFVTNFSCGPDAFLVGYFRDIMKTKPSLTLEIDGHLADAGVNTRVEAFLDIVERYRRLGVQDPETPAHRPAGVVVRGGRTRFVASDLREYSFQDPQVKVVFPSMGRTLSEAASAAFRGLGIRSECVPLPDARTLAAGRSHTCCKECLPLILTVGSLLEYLDKRRANGELTVYFMPSTNGNCRFSQYSVFINGLIQKNALENVVTFTLTSENGYSGLGLKPVLRLLKGVIVADVMDDIRNAILALARDRSKGLAVFDAVWRDILQCFEHGCSDLERVLTAAAARLRGIALRGEVAGAKKVLLAGEIYTRKDEFSSQRVVETLSERGIVVSRAAMLEWIHYVDYWVQHIERRALSPRDLLEMKLRQCVMKRVERRIKSLLASSGLYEYETESVADVIKAARRLVDQEFGCETSLVVGRYIKDALDPFHGLISIGPFSCMPTRITESLLEVESRAAASANLPFLSIEVDGNPLPQIVEARLEAFCLQVERAFAAARTGHRTPARALLAQTG